MGRRNAPTYRIVVAESSMPRDGRIVESIGHYNPRTDPLTLSVDRNRALYWLGHGATPTDTAHALLKRAGVFKPVPEGVDGVEEVAATVTAAAANTADKVTRKVKEVAAGVREKAEEAREAIAEAAEDVREAASEAAEEVREKVAEAREAGAEIAEEVRENVAEAREAASEAAEELRETVGEVAEKVGDVVEATREKVADAIESVTSRGAEATDEGGAKA